MSDNAENLTLTKCQERLMQKLAKLVNEGVNNIFQRDISFILTVSDHKEDNFSGFTISNLDKENAFQIYVDIFCALKDNLNESVKKQFTCQLLSQMLTSDEEKKEAFYWLLNELHDNDNVYSIKS